MSLKEKILSAIIWWNGATLNTRLWSWRKGTKVGEDAAGNVFYQNDDGSRRWVIFNGEVEGSRISAEWHGWMHHTWDKPPTELDLPHKAWEKPHLPNLTGTNEAFAPAGSIRRVQPVHRQDYEAWSPK